DAIRGGPHGLRQRLRGDGEHDEVAAPELDVRGALDADALRQLYVREVALVLALAGDLLSRLLRAGAELDLEPAAREQHRHRRAPAARADHRRLTERRQSAQVLPLQLDVRPDALGDARREARRGAVGARERERRAGAQRDLARPDAPALAHVLAPQHGHREHGRARLEGQAADAALRPGERTPADAGALGEDDDGAAALDGDPGRLHRGLVGLAAADRKG